MQAATTPLLQNIPKGLDSMSVGSAEFLQISEGTYPTHNETDPFVIKLLKQLKKPNIIQEAAARSPDEYRHGWKMARESTSSSLSGLHFGHYMAGIEDLITEKIN